MRYPAKIAHSGMIYYFLLLRDFSLYYSFLRISFLFFKKNIYFNEEVVRLNIFLVIAAKLAAK